MAIQKFRLIVSGEVGAEQRVADTYTPANGEEIYICCFNGQACFTPNSAVYVAWDYGGENEVILFSTKGSAEIHLESEIIGDGTKKIAVVCDNGEPGPVVMSGGLCLCKKI